MALHLNQPRDVGGFGPAASGAFNTLSALLTGQDFTDLYPVTGVTARVRVGAAERWVGGEARLERHRSFDPDPAEGLRGAGTLRPVNPIDPGVWAGGSVGAGVRGVAGDGEWEGAVRLEGGQLAGEAFSTGYLSGLLEWRVDRKFEWRSATIAVESGAGLGMGELPRQALFLLGGRGTVPGHDFRAYGGDRATYAMTRVGADLSEPWVRVYGIAAAGWSGDGGASGGALAAWGAAPTPGVISSIGAGVGLFYDLVRIDAVRGLGPGGLWEFVIEARRDFWPWL
jgi:hypothetical protein